jgi:acetyl/propionyl-CoA carboxylase alpha subunit
VRVDSGIETGLEVSTYYDPILAKIITWGEDREMARIRMIHALQEMVILGVVTPDGFLIDVLEHPAFVAGETHTGFLDDHGFLNGDPSAEAVPDDVLLAAALQRSARGEAAAGAAAGPASTPWTELGAWRPGS